MKRFFFIPVLLLMVSLISLVYGGEITERAAKPGDVFQLRKELAYHAGHKLLGSAGISSATTYLTVTNTPVAIVDNEFVTLTATNTLSFTSGHTSLGDGEMCYFGVCVDGSGDYSTIQGPITTTANYLKVPMPVSGKTMIGLVKVVCTDPGVFVPGTTSVAAPASATITITNVHSLPISLNLRRR